ncbi:MAG: transcription antitermination factor NusB [Lentisphaeria bacterium]|nr:transcription antitermination factor NusB [Lentisphaeria bacterium]
MASLVKPRRKARVWTLQFLFSNDVENSGLDNFSKAAVSRFWDMLMESSEAKDLIKFPESKVAATAKIEGIINHTQEIDAVILGAAKNWTINRMALVDRNLIRLATYEMMFDDEIPAKVSINEGIEIAKLFADKDSTKFINGVLDRIKKDLEK